jgi:uncharacterized DUF497 family protein
MARVTWDERKRLRVLASRGVDFILVSGIFEGPMLIEPDRRREYGEARYIAIGEFEGEYYTVVYTPRIDPGTGEDIVRIITAWRSGRRPRNRHQELYLRRAPGDEETG